jgi:hypothetical protein
VKLSSVVVILSTACLLTASSYAADVTPWKLTLNTNVTVGLSTYSDSWVGGEAGSFSWAWQFLGGAEKQLTPSLLTTNTLKLGFGQTKTQNKDTKTWSVPQKSTDLIDFETVERLTLGGWVDPYISGHVISEFVDGRIAECLHYGNPIDISEALGIARTLVKQEQVDWSVRLGGAARQLVDRYTLDPSESKGYKSDVNNDGGVELVTDLKAANKAKWASYATTVRLYEALASSKAKDLQGDAKNDWRYPNANWENSLTLNVTKYIMVNGYVQFLYDRLIHKNWRLKETLGVGLTYMYSNSK